MLQDYCESFTLMTAAKENDGLGARVLRYKAGETFSAALCSTPGMADTPGGLTAARQTPVLLHPREMTFMPGDVVRREADGVLYRVLDCSDFMRTPLSASMAFAQVTLERVVNSDG